MSGLMTLSVSYQIGEKGAVKVLYVDDSEGCVAPELDKEIKSSFLTPRSSCPSAARTAPVQLPIPILWPVTQPRPSSPFGPAHHFHHRLLCSHQVWFHQDEEGVGPQVGVGRPRPPGWRLPQPHSSLAWPALPPTTLLKQKSLSLSLHSLDHHRQPSPSVPALTPAPRSSCTSGGGSPSLFFDGADR